MIRKYIILKKIFIDTDENIPSINFLKILHENLHINIDKLPESAIDIITMENFLRFKYLRVFNRKYLSNKLIFYLKQDKNDSSKKYLLSLFHNNKILNKDLQSSTNHDILGIWGKQNLENILNENEYQNLQRRTLLHSFADTVILLNLDSCLTYTTSLIEEKRSIMKMNSCLDINSQKQKQINYDRYMYIIQQQYTPNDLLMNYKTMIRKEIQQVLHNINDISFEKLLDMHTIDDYKKFWIDNFTNKEQESIFISLENEIKYLITNFSFQIQDPNIFWNFRKRYLAFKNKLKD